MNDFYDVPLISCGPPRYKVFGVRPDGERVLLKENVPLSETIQFRNKLRGEFSRLVLEYSPSPIPARTDR